MASLLTPEQAEFVRKPHVAVLATTGAEGQPHAVPMWYLFDGTAFVIETERGSQKHRNLERRAEATLVIDHRQYPYYALMLRCRMVPSSDLPDLTRSQIAARYLREPELSTYLEQYRGSDAVVMRLEPIEIVADGDLPNADLLAP